MVVRPRRMLCYVVFPGLGVQEILDQRRRDMCALLQKFCWQCGALLDTSNRCIPSYSTIRKAIPAE